MTWADVSTDPVDFDEAIEQFRKLVPVGDDDFDRLTARAQRKAFKVAGVANLDLVQDVFDSIDDAIAKGTDLDDFKDAVGEALESAWHGDVENPGWRLETIFRTNVQRSYSEGRYKQATDPDVLQDRPFWQFDAILDDATTEVCEDCNGTVLDADDPWWLEHQPPLHFNCRSTFITLTPEQAAAEGGAVDKPPESDAEDGFGLPPPDETDEDQEAGAFEPDLTGYDAGLAKEFEQQQEEAPPPVEPKQAKEGVHFSTLDRGDLGKADSARADLALQALTDHGLLNELEATPLRKVRFTSTITDASIPKNIRSRVHGFCTSSGELVLRTKPPVGGFQSVDFVPGESFTLASAAKDWDDAIGRNMLHEAAHHLHFTGGQLVDDVIRSTYKSPASKPITKYAGTDHYEYWAETFSAYKLDPEALKAHDRRGFHMVEDVLKLRKNAR